MSGIDVIEVVYDVERAEAVGSVNGHTGTVTLARRDLFPAPTWNAAALRRVRAALANGSGPVDVVVIGDSMTEGYGSGGDYTTRWPAVAVARLRERWQPAGVTGSDRGYVPAYAAPFTFTGTSSVYSLGGLQMRARTLTAGATASWTVDGTGFRVVYQQRTSGAATVSIDGGAATALPVTGAVLEGGHAWESAVLAAGSHTLTVTCTSGTVVLEGAYAYNGDNTTGIRLWESGHAGWSTADWMATTRWSESVTGLDPALVIIALGVNDYQNSIAPATFRTNLEAMVALVRGSLDPPPAVALQRPHQREATSPAYGWAAYDAVYFDVAEADGDIALLDMAGTVGERTSAEALGILNADLVHPTAYGNRLIGADMAAQIAP